MKNSSFKSISMDSARNAVAPIRPSGKAVIASLAALLIAAGALAISGCSKSKNDQTANSGSQSQIAPAQSTVTPSTSSPAAIALNQSQPPKKSSAKGPVKRLALRTYKDADSGVSFAYPRRATLEVNDIAQQDPAFRERLPMSYTESGGTTLAVVELPILNDGHFHDLFLFNINKQLTAEKCNQFPIDNHVDGELSSSEASASQTKAFANGSRIMVRDVEYSMLEKNFDEGSIRYYHRFVPAASGDTGVCYEFGMFANAEPEQKLNHSTAEPKDVFVKLEKILASVKIAPKQVMEAEKTDSAAKVAPLEQPTETAKAVSKDESPR